MAARLYSPEHPLRVALAGYGNVGRTLGPRLAGGEIPEIELTAVSAARLDRAAEAVGELPKRPLVVAAAELPRHADVIVECATYDAFAEVARATLEAGKTLVAVSVGALAANLDLIDLAERHGGVIQIANGAMPGLDEIRCAREGTILSVRLKSRIRPDSLAKEQYVREQGFDFSTPPASPVRVFSGTAREAAAAFPRHFNVAVALSLAGIGLDRTEIEVWCDPDIPGAIHRVEVDADEIRLEMTAHNRPSPTNRNTSRIVAPSIMAALRQMVATVRAGS